MTMLDATAAPEEGVADLLDTARPADGSRTGPRRFWTTAELRALDAAYPVGGLPGALAALPGRSARAIYSLAGARGLRAPAGKGTRLDGRPRERWTKCDRIDDVIRRRWPEATTRNALLRLARDVGRPRWWVSRRAVALGFAAPRFKEPEWSEAELRILREQAHRAPETVARALLRAGFRRSATAITVKRRRLGIARDRESDGRISARALAQLMGVASKTVCGWIERGWLRAHGRRGAGETAEHRLSDADIKRFITENTAMVDVRKCDKFWLVELLANGPRVAAAKDSAL